MQKLRSMNTNRNAGQSIKGKFWAIMPKKISVLSTVIFKQNVENQHYKSRMIGPIWYRSFVSSKIWKRPDHFNTRCFHEWHWFSARCMIRDCQPLGTYLQRPHKPCRISIYRLLWNGSLLNPSQSHPRVYHQFNSIPAHLLTYQMRDMQNHQKKRKN